MDEISRPRGFVRLQTMQRSTGSHIFGCSDNRIQNDDCPLCNEETEVVECVKICNSCRLILDQCEEKLCL
jgi:hypothetical protein